MGQSSGKPQMIALAAIVGTLVCATFVAKFVAQRQAAQEAAAVPLDSYPPLPAPASPVPGVKVSEVQLSRGGVPMAVWIYLPDPLPKAKLPCVLIAPAGSRLFHGMRLTAGDREEHLPYVLVGFAVVAYELDGPFPQRRGTDEQAREALALFRRAHYGIDNAAAALDYALKTVPKIDANRIYAVGHSSAATLALQVAEHDPRIAACVAFAPVTDVPDHLRMIADTLHRYREDSMDDLEKYSPQHNIQNLKCPTMLFTAHDDETVPTESSSRSRRSSRRPIAK
jgi:dipeptidyl aminopeptidase/acylaminoacyl peptidase